MSIKPAFSDALKARKKSAAIYGIKKVSDYVPEEEYHGTYEAVSKAFEDSYLETKNKRLRDNIHVKEIPYYETSNLSDGVTVYIGSEIEFE